MRDRTILALKGLAIIGVAYHHINNRRLEPDAIAWATVITMTFHWCVLGFLLVSGYLQALSDSRKHRTFLEFLHNRVARLLVPYAVLILFYSCIWQLVQAAHIPNLSGKIPPGFLEKIEAALWPVDNRVAEQLYFFPLLFGISVVLVIVQKLLGLYGTAASAIVAGVFGLLFYPTYFTGFLWGTFIWGLNFYACGYVFFHYRERKTAVRFALVLITLIFIIGSGYPGLIRCIPLWLLAEGTTMGVDRIPLLLKLGDASGTIYIYHTPFLIAPLVIAATYLPGKIGQFIGINLAVAIAIGLCYLLFETLKNTRAKSILM